MSRKRNLVDFGFLAAQRSGQPTATGQEFDDRKGQAVYMSATPGDYEMAAAGGEFVEQVIRPTGWSTAGRGVSHRGADRRPHRADPAAGRRSRSVCWSTTLTKRMAEDLTDYLLEHGGGAHALLHRHVEACGTTAPVAPGRSTTYSSASTCCVRASTAQVSLVAILDADKEGFLRSERSLV